MSTEEKKIKEQQERTREVINNIARKIESLEVENNKLKEEAKKSNVRSEDIVSKAGEISQLKDQLKENNKLLESQETKLKAILEGIYYEGKVTLELAQQVLNSSTVEVDLNNPDGGKKRTKKIKMKSRKKSKKKSKKNLKKKSKKN